MTGLKFTTSVDVLRDAASRVSGAVEPNSERPVLANLLITAKDNVVRLAATDCRVSIVYEVSPAAVMSEGQGLINANKFLQILKLFRDVEAEVSSNDRGHFTFKAPGASYKIPGDDVRDYPPIKGALGNHAVEIAAAELVRLFDQTTVAAAIDGQRYAIDGICVKHEGTTLRFAATDARRIAVSEAEVKSSCPPFAEIIRAKSAKALLKVVGKSSTFDVRLAVVGSHLVFCFPKGVVSCNLLNGKFPPYEDIFQLSLPQAVDLDVHTFDTLLRRSSLLEDSETAFNFSTDNLQLQTTSKVEGESIADIPVSYSGPAVRIGFIPSLWLDGVAVLPGTECRFRFDNHLRAGLMLPLVTASDGTKSESTSFRYYVMPYRLNGEGE